MNNPYTPAPDHQHPAGGGPVANDTAGTKPDRNPSPTVAQPPRPGATPQAPGVAEANPPTSSSKPPPVTTEVIRQFFGSGTKIEILDLTDHRLDPRQVQALKTRPDRPDKVVAIECGQPSQGLCALIVPNKQTADLFLKTNPMLAGTLVTTTSNLIYIWLRASGWHPQNTASDGMVWVSTGFVLVPDILVNGTPAPTVVTSSFAGLRWPPDLESKFHLAQTFAEFGPCYQNVGKKKQINLASFARIIARPLGLKFDADAQTFCRQKLGEKSIESISTANVIELVITFLTKVAAEDPTNFPEGELCLPRIKQLIEHIQLATAFARPNLHESLIEYVRTRLCQKPGRDLTVQEIYGDFLVYTRERNLPLYPKSKFYMELAGVMQATLGVLRVNNIRRPVPGIPHTTSRRGFHGVAFRTDGLDGAGANDGSDWKTNQPAPKNTSMLS